MRTGVVRPCQQVREGLYTMLQHYKGVTESLTEVEKTLFSKKLKQLKEAGPRLTAAQGLTAVHVH